MKITDMTKTKSEESGAKKKGPDVHEKTDIVDLILQDHQHLKELIQILKQNQVSLLKKRAAFKEFAPLLLRHAGPEQQSLYQRMKEQGPQMRIEGFEGETEHAIADQLVRELSEVKEQDAWMAKVKVLAELVENHIQEEESIILKGVRKEFGQAARNQIGRDYLRLKQNMTADETLGPSENGNPSHERIH